MKGLKKFAVICILINILVLLISLKQLEVQADFISDIDSGAKVFLNTGKDQAGSANGITTSITENFTGIGQLLTLFGAGVMVAVVTFMGIKYLTASPDKQAALKQQLVGVVVAGVVIFGAYGIWSMVVGILNTATS